MKQALICAGIVVVAMTLIIAFMLAAWYGLGHQMPWSS